MVSKLLNGSITSSFSIIKMLLAFILNEGVITSILVKLNGEVITSVVIILNEEVFRQYC